MDNKYQPPPKHIIKQGKIVITNFRTDNEEVITTNIIEYEAAHNEQYKTS